MGVRSFTSPDGTSWQAWCVIPGQHADWPEHARRHLPEAMAAGWVCFESATEKRRLQPIPAGWDERPDADLWDFCLSAQPVRRAAPPRPASADLSIALHGPEGVAALA